MREEISEAIESARSVGVDGISTYAATPQRRRSAEMVRAITLAVVRELPDDMSVAELRDELEISNNQQVGR